MEIADLQSIGLTAPRTQSNEETSEDTFMTLMLAQLQNQDPMAPMENGEFLSQRAEFETAAGIDDLETAFTQFSTSMLSAQSLQAASMIDRNVVVEGDTTALPVDGELVGGVQLPQSATNVVVEIHDPAGQLVHTLELGTAASGETLFEWDGELDDGSYAPPGNYMISARAEMDGELRAVSTQVASEVESVVFDERGIVLTLANGMEVPFEQVQQIT